MKKFRKNNKGFSLIELIIVVAIMVALIVVLAPQYLKQVEKARVSADEDIISEFMNAVKVAALDEDFDVEDGSIELNKDAAPDVTGTDIADALTEYYGAYDGAKLKSKKYEDGVTISIETDSTTNSITVTCAEYAPGEDEAGAHAGG